RLRLSVDTRLIGDRGRLKDGASVAWAGFPLSLQRGQESIAPGIDRIRTQGLEHGPPARDSLGERHGETAMQRIGEAVEIERVQDQRGLELTGRTGEA